MRKRYALVGAGGRGLWMYGKRLVEDAYRDICDFVAVCDPNPLRAKYFAEECQGEPQVFDDFSRMIAESRPDVVIVTTPDVFHDQYIVEAMQASCDVITEKPMTVDARRCRAILDAEQATGRRLKMIFNMRYMPYASKLKELMLSGMVGEVLAASLQWRLDRSHGADYFRRWHRRMDRSGSLLLHKSSHHFDLVNWLIADTPQTVAAFGDLHVYGPQRAERSERCLGCPYADSCEFYFDIEADPRVKRLYRDTESADGYWRDGCVFSPQVDIYDTMCLQVRYASGAIFDYSLNAYNPHEFWTLSIAGTKGRLEASDYYSGPKANEPDNVAVFIANDGTRQEIRVPKASGDHGGSDALLFRDLVRGVTEDPLGHQAGSLDGARALLIGAAANVAIQEKRLVDIGDLIDLPGLPKQP